MDATKLWLLSSLLASFLSSCIGISCYSCWTKGDPKCAEPETLGSYHEETCPFKDNVCKKIQTDFYKIEKRGQSVVYMLMSNITSRICGRADWSGCRKTKGAASWTTECACEDDLCNTTNYVHPTVFLVTLLAVGVAYISQLH